MASIPEDQSHILIDNVGSGQPLSIAEFAKQILIENGAKGKLLIGSLSTGTEK